MEFSAENYKFTSGFLKDHGYDHYEISSFSKSNQTKSIHNKKYIFKDSYWDLAPFYAFGMGATSFLNNYRYARPNNISKYYRYIKEIDQLGIEPFFASRLQKEEHFEKLEMFMMGKLRTKYGLDLASVPPEVATLIRNFYSINEDIY